MKAPITYKIAGTEADFAQARELFLEYADSLDTDLCFQNFSRELQTLEEQYGNPQGALCLAFDESLPVGCVGVRRLDNETAELKRMYVRPASRGHQIGKHLLELALDAATTLGYRKIRLDTLPSMESAQQLYHSFGFSVIPSYRFNPVEGTIYMEKEI